MYAPGGRRGKRRRLRVNALVVVLLATLAGAPATAAPVASSTGPGGAASAGGVGAASAVGVGAASAVGVGAGGLSLALAALPSPVAFGAPLSVVGHLSGAGSAARVVVLQQNPYPFTGGFRAIGNPQLTNADGAFQFNLISLPVTTQFLVVTVGPGEPVSATLTVPVRLAVSTQVSVHPTRHGYANAVFSGLISPAQAGARVSVQRLVDGQWRLLVATYASASAAAAGGSSYTAALRLRHGGYYRVFASPIEDSHLASFSPPTLVHVSGH